MVGEGLRCPKWRAGSTFSPATASTNGLSDSVKVIRARFDRLTELRVVDLVRAVGVYVIWDGQARARPTYIGEGTVLTRLADHANRFTPPFDGYVAILGDTSSRTAKREAEIVEALLLAVAEDTDRLPPHNKAPGKTTGIERIFRSHGVLRASISGYDPLGIPWQSRRLAAAKTIRLEHLGLGALDVRHGWRLRRLQS